MYFSPTVLPIEVKLGLQIGGRLRKITNSKPPGAMIMIGQSKIGSKRADDHILLGSSLAGVTSLCCASHSPDSQTKLYKNVGPKPFW